MFTGVINDARRAANSLIGKFLGRAVVAVPFVIAGGFATAALTLMLIDRFGAQVAYWLVALLFTFVGVLAAAVVTVKEQESDAETLAADEQEQTTLQAVDEALTPVAMLAPLLTSPFAASAGLTVLRWSLRNVPVLVLAALIVLLNWPTGQPAGAAADAGEASAPPAPDGIGARPAA